MNPPTQTRKKFGAYEFDRESHELWKENVRLKISGQPLAVLGLLLERPGSLVTRDDLRKRLWPADTFVDFEHSLNTAIKRLRAALNDDSENPKYVETIPKRGYRFIGTVENSSPASQSAESNTSARPEGAPSQVWRKNFVRNLLWAGSALVVLTLALVGILRLRSAHPSSPQRVMLAVLPFQNLSGDPTQDYFGDGLTDETITQLAQLSPEKLGLIARTSAMTYKGTSKTIAQIGNELGVDYVVEGSLRRDTENVRISVQLIRVHDQSHVWAHSYDRALHDLLALEADLGQDIAEQVRVQLTSEARAHLSEVPNVNPDAYESYLRGRHLWARFRLESLNQAIDYYNQALEKEPKYARAFAGLANAYSTRANLYGKPAENYAKSRAYAEQALRLDDSLAEAHEAMAAVHIFHDWDWAAADKELRRCEELGAPSPEHSLRAYWYEARGDMASAISALKRGLRLDPFNPLLNADLGFAYYYAREPDGLIVQYRQTKEADPNFPLANNMLALAYKEKGDLGAATAEYRRLGDRVELAAVQAKQGDIRAVRELLDKVRKNSSKESPDPSTMVSLCHALGDKDCTFTWLEKEYADRDPWLIWLRVDPANDDLRSDTRFQQLSDRIGLQ